MPLYEHLRLARLPEQFERRKRPGFGSLRPRVVAAHAAKLQNELQAVIAAQRAPRAAVHVDPSLILAVKMAAGLQIEEWEQLGVRVLSSDSDRTLILFASRAELEDLAARLTAYAQGTPPGQKHPMYAGFVSNIDEIGAVEPVDRIGRVLRDEGFSTLEDFAEDELYVLDLELWDIGSVEVRTQKIAEIRQLIANAGAATLDEYVGPSISMLRVRAPGRVIRELLAIAEVASIDRLPQVDADTSALLERDLADLPPLEPLDQGSPIVGVIDSGITDHPLLASSIVGAIGVPALLGTADEWGHGTRVGGVALFGDLRAQLLNGTLRGTTRLCFAKVLNDTGSFDETRLVPSVMREAIQRLNAEFGCRIFVLALADKKNVYTGGKVGAWAATLDELARDLDVVIIVSAGNRLPRQGALLEEGVTEFPDYLLEASNRLFEPAGAANVLTVGALAHGNGLDADHGQYLHVQAIAERDEPAPFTRVGPGVGGATKPDLVDIGGTLVFDGGTARLHNGSTWPSAGLVTLHHKFVDRLFTTASGTSLAAPLVAQRAADVLRILPAASANLIRALLVGSAQIPEEAKRCLALQPAGSLAKICGHGKASTERASYSSDGRVVLYAEEELRVDHFAVFHVPVPDEFRTLRGRRRIDVTLAFDPPVRHTRNDYLGIGMNFRLIRGTSADDVFEHFRRRAKNEKIPEIADKYQCKLEPGPQERDKGTVQRGTVTFAQNVDQYGADYFLVVRCLRGWAAEDRQRFAVVVELSHEASTRLYQQIQIQQRIRLQA